MSADEMTTFGVEVVSMSKSEVISFGELARAGASTAVLQSMISLGETHIFDARQYAGVLSRGGISDSSTASVSAECTAHVVRASQIVNLGGKVHRNTTFDICMR
jgi:hypothetical protein